MPESWPVKSFAEFATLHRGYDLPIQDRKKGSIPIVGSNGIVGYHNEAKVKGPGVVTGRSGSIGISYYVGDDYWPLNTGLYVEDFHGNNLFYVHYFFQSFNFGKYAAGVSVPTLNRNLVHEASVSVPQILEQQKIAAVLFKIQKAIEVQESIVEKTRELKKSTLHHVFTHGLRGEKLKETEIGPMPESWLIGKIGDIGKIVTGTTPPTKHKEYYQGGHYQFIAPNDIGKTTRIYETEKKITDKGLEVSRLLPKESVCFVCIGSTIGKVGITVEEKTTTNQQINSVIVNNDYDPYFVTYLMDYKSEYIASFASPSPVPILSKGKFEEINIMLSSDIEEQKEIARVLMIIDETIEIHTAKKSALQDLFKTMLNKLMTGEIRVKDLDIDVSEVSA
ncbi:MAG: restriction endonuclease subunit S [Desulfovibrionales bacterium]|nr:restriction endonuclease subunit S [Desulfovibrionales bacterium]